MGIRALISGNVFVEFDIKMVGLDNSLAFDVNTNHFSYETISTLFSNNHQM